MWALLRAAIEYQTSASLTKRHLLLNDLRVSASSSERQAATKSSASFSPSVTRASFFVSPLKRRSNSVRAWSLPTQNNFDGIGGSLLGCESCCRFSQCSVGVEN